MQVVYPTHYPKDGMYHTKKISALEPLQRRVNISEPSLRAKFITRVEAIVRGSLEIKAFTKFANKYLDMTQCSFFNGIDKSKGGGKVSIEIHHEPFTLFDIVNIVLTRRETEQLLISELSIAEEVAKLHYEGKVGLIPVSKTVHKLVHKGEVLIPLQRVFGGFLEFVHEYENYIPDDLIEMLQQKIEDSKNFTPEDLSILEKRFLYLDIEGQDPMDSVKPL